MSNIISRRDARDLRLVHYFTGVPCRNGHLAPRYVVNCACTECIRDYNQQFTREVDAAENVVTRADAKRQGLGKYFTGRPCVNGHIAPRYTVSGACSECLREYNNPTVSDRVTLRRQIDDSFVKKRFRIFDTDYEFFSTVVLSQCMQIIPEITKLDVVRNFRPKDKAVGTALYAFMIHPSLIEELQAVANNLLDKR